MSSVVPDYLSPVPPDRYCGFSQMVQEWDRLLTFRSLAHQILPSGVFPVRLANQGYFQTLEGWILCFDCQLHYGIGHTPWCEAIKFSIPFHKYLTGTQQPHWTLIKEAVDSAMNLGIFHPRCNIVPPMYCPPIVQPFVAQPSSGPLDLDFSDTRPVAPRRRPSVLEGLRFQIGGKNKTICQLCGEPVVLEQLTPVQGSNLSLPYLIQKHAVRSPACTRQFLI